MTSMVKKLPVAIGILFFGVAGASAMFHGADLPTAFLRGLAAGAIGTLFAWFPAYLIFAGPLPQAKTPPGLEHLEEKFKPKTGQ